jgi:hypothetical protein
VVTDDDRLDAADIAGSTGGLIQAHPFQGLQGDQPLSIPKGGAGRDPDRIQARR